MSTLTSKKASYDSLKVAKYIIDRSIYLNNPTSNLSLQSKMFLLQTLYLKMFKKPLFDENFRVGRFSPMLLDIYLYYGIWAGMKIDELQNSNIKLSNDVLDIIDNIIINFTSWNLFQLTNGKDSLNYQLYKSNKKIIDKDLIYNYPISKKLSKKLRR